jgi:mannose-1-phosphate guanylyltransferase
VKAVIMAGGKGTRLRPLTDRLPKPMVPVGPLRCIDYVLRSLTSAGVHEVIVTTGYLSDHIIRGIADGAYHGVSVVYSFEDEPLGTAGGVRHVLPFLGDEPFIVASGDVLADVNIRGLLDRHAKNRDRGAVATLALTRVEDPTQYGIVGLDENGRVTRFREKPRKEQVFSDLINAGIYIIEPEAIAEVPARQTYDFSRDLWPDLLERGMPLYGEPLEGFWMDVGRPEDLIEANLRIIRREGRPLPGNPDTTVLQGSRVRLGHGVRLSGAVYLADLVRLGEGAELRDCAVHNGAVIGRRARVERSLLIEDCEVGPGATVRDSVLAAGSVVGAGATVERCVLGEAAEVPADVTRRGVRIPER